MPSSLNILVKQLQAGLPGGASSTADMENLLREVDLTRFKRAPEADWAAFFDVLVGLWRSPDPDLAEISLHWLGSATWFARLTNGPVQCGFPQDFPTDRFLSSARLHAERGGDNIYDLFARMQSTFRHIEEAPRAVRRLYDRLTTWLQKLDPADPRLARVRPGIVAATQSAFLPLPAWPTARIILLDRARNAKEDIARAAAAWRIGQVYLEALEAAPDEPLDPPLAVMAATLATMDIARPGVAGPFLAAFVNDLKIWRSADGPEPAAWILDILEHRAEPEPDTLPVANGIDFLTHELVSTPADIKRLVAIGRRDFAEASAYEAGIDLDSLLGEKTES